MTGPIVLAGIAVTATAAIVAGMFRGGFRPGRRESQATLAAASGDGAPPIDAGASEDPEAVRLARRLLSLANAQAVAATDQWAWREAATTAARLVDRLEHPASRPPTATTLSEPCRR